MTVKSRSLVPPFVMKLLFRASVSSAKITLKPFGSPVAAVVHETKTGSFLRAASSGSIALLASYAKGEWESTDLYVLMNSLWHTERLLRKAHLLTWPLDLLRSMVSRALRGVSGKTAPVDYSEVSGHYDLPMDLFQSFLGRDLAYSGTQIRNHPENYAAAYDGTYRLLLEKLLGTRKECLILDLGCGWGAFSRHVLENSTHSLHAVTISASQASHVRKTLAQYIPSRLELVNGDFTVAENLPAHADAVIMLETIEHIEKSGRSRLFSLLAKMYPQAPVLVQFTASPNWTALQKSGKPTAGNSLIFPGPTELPSLREVVSQAGQAGYRAVGVEDLTFEYSAITLAWRSRFLSHSSQLAEVLPIDSLRAWDFYLTGLTTALSQRSLRSYQLILAR